MQEVIIRKATKEDYIDIAHVHYQSWIETYTNLMPDEYLKTRNVSKSEEIFKNNWKNIIVAIKDKKIIGFISYNYEARKIISIPESSDIQGLYLLKNYHHQGIGYLLVKSALKELPHDKVCLYVLKENLNAISFYQKIGFKFTSKNIIQDVPGGKLVELEMCLNLGK